MKMNVGAFRVRAACHGYCRNSCFIDYQNLFCNQSNNFLVMSNQIPSVPANLRPPIDFPPANISKLTQVPGVPAGILWFLQSFAASSSSPSEQGALASCLLHWAFVLTVRPSERGESRLKFTFIINFPIGKPKPKQTNRRQPIEELHLMKASPLRSLHRLNPIQFLTTLRLFPAPCFAAAAVALAGPASAATISFVNSGVPDTTTLDAWRTSSVVKTLDGDGDNVYGTDGYYMAGPVGITVPIYLQSVSLSATNYGGDGNYAVIDSPSNVPNNVTSGLFFRTNTFATVMSFTVSSTLVGSKSFRVGILNNNQGHSSNDNSGLTPDFIGVNQTSGGSATSGTLDSSSTPTPFQARAHWIFFDISGAVANDTFAINIGSDGAPHNQTGIGGLTFDTIPEPTSMGLLGLGLMGLCARRRR